MRRTLNFTRASFALLFLLLLVCLCSSCKKNENSKEYANALIATGTDYTLSGCLPSSIEDSADLLCEPGIHRIATFNEGVISLYGINDPNKLNANIITLINWDGLMQSFDIAYLNTGGLSLTPYCFDVDHDGSDEIIIINYEGGGTETSDSTLHVIKKNEEIC